MEATWIERGVVIGVILLMLIIGIITSKRGSSTIEDLWIAKRNLSPFVLALTLSATWADSGMFLGTASSGYSDGLVWFIPWWLAYAFTPWLLLLTGVSRRARELGLITSLDVFSRRYGRTAAIVGACFSAAAETIWASSAFLALSLVLSVFLDIPLQVTVLLTAGVVLVYTSVGGMWAVAYTDVFQFFLLVIGQVVLLFFLLFTVGGLSVLAALSERTGASGYPMLSLIPTDFPGVVSWLNYLIFISLGGMLYNSIFTRYCAARDPKEAARSNIFFGSFYIVWEVILILIGLYAAVTLGQLENPDTAVPMLVLNAKGAGVVGRIIAVVVALGVAGAALSTNDSNLLACSTMVTRNIVQLLSPEMDERRMIAAFRLVTIAVALVMVFLALYVPSVVFLVLFCTELVFASLFIPFIFGFFWKEANSYGAIASMIVGVVVWLTWRVLLEGPWIFPAAATAGAVAAAIAMVLVSKATAKSCPPVPLAEQAGSESQLQTRGAPMAT